ncbi:hypothetical protein GCG54_00004301 [Colletotrichum gloeosporioides]|uniref:Uncharacterized protein n=1 Tax=Colletotrichum gloeosporioides TaxID=474922 RepID=A0A8H4CMF3_COLGL|nr:uncharacterized protein GCG54_00004301 [Colletotrichum gloeosporioides]KAF3806668.1 hypothetical protein GCG54_00004301 [Colletotrichum gloeosporioides]
MPQTAPPSRSEAPPDRGDDADESLLSASEGRIRQRRQNFWLRRSVLIAFSFLFIACTVALIGVSRHATAQDGLPLSLSSSSYSWNYGPTGVLVVILALWRQVDFNCRSMQPWWEMTHGPSTADRSVLLDYISPFQPIACVSAFKNGHHAVFISTLTFFILKFIIFLSTTLFVVEPTWHLESIPFRYQNTFNTEHIWRSPGDGIQDISRQGDATAWSYMAAINNATAKDLNGAASGSTAYQSLSPPKFSSNISSVSAVVDVFVPSVRCGEASLSLPKTTFTEKSALYYNINSPSCSSGDLESIYLSCHPSCKDTERSYSIHRLDCASHDDLDDKRSSESSDPNIRYAITIADLLMTSEEDQYTSVNIERASSTICEVGYGMVLANATLDISSGQVTLNENPVLGDSPRRLPNMTNHDLAMILIANLDVASDTLLVDPSIDDKAKSKDAFSFFQLLAAQLRTTQGSLNSLLQQSLLAKLSEGVFEGMSIAFAKKALLLEDSDGELFEGVAEVAENRLHLRNYTLWPMVSGFFILSIFCILLCFMIPTGGDQLNVEGSIASCASLLANSPSLLAVLKDTGHFRSNQLRRKLEDLHFIVSHSRDGPRIEAFGSTREVLSPLGQRKKRPWLPLPAKLPMVLLSFLLPFLVIVLLEILQHLSDMRQGLLDLDSSSSATLSYAVRLVSTLLAFLVATLFNNLDFTIAVLNPFGFLRSGSVPADRSILFHLLGVSPFLILFNTFRLRHFGSAASNFSTLLASFLTIVVSGLWVMGSPVQTLSVTSAMVEDWDASWLTNNHDDQRASITLNIVRHGGASTTSSIQGYDVLPKISLGSTAYLDRANNTYESTVLRPVLDCKPVPQEEIIFAPMTRRIQAGKIGHWITVAGATVTFNQTVPFGCSPKASQRGSTRDLVGDCPSVAILFGKFEVTDGLLVRNNLTALFCSQKIEEIPATITYRGNPTNFDLDNIKIHSEKTKHWVNGTSNSTNLAFKIQGFLNSGLTRFPVPCNQSNNCPNYYDNFFNHILFGPQGISPTDILGSSNTGSLSEAVTHSLKEYFAQVVDLNFRSRDSETSVQGTSLQTTTRLAIHKVSKIILQSLLAATTVLSFVGYSLVKIRGTLPRNPCSIASTMGFLADSQLCDPKTGILPKDASLMTEQELTKSLHGFFSAWAGGNVRGTARLAGPQVLLGKRAVTWMLEMNRRFLRAPISVSTLGTRMIRGFLRRSDEARGTVFQGALLPKIR